MPRKHFTHLLDHDAKLLASFLAANPDRYHHLDFDIHVGHGRDPGDNFPHTIRQMGITLSQRRIDCIGVSPGRIDIIEVTAQAGLTALGQLIAYPRLYEDTYSPDRPVYPVLVAYEFAADIEALFEMSNIEFHLMPRPAS